MNDLTPMKFGQKNGVGSSIPRKEDDRFVKGEGFYPSDHKPEGCLTAFVVRSPFAHARFEIKDMSAARAMDGVHLVMTHADIAEFGSLPNMTPRGKNAAGKPYDQPPRLALCEDTVRFVGDPVAFIVADSKALAADAAELLEIDYTPLDAVVGIEDAMADGAPLVWEGYEPNNMASESSAGNLEATKAAMAKADQVIDFTVINNRLVCNYMETRACVAEYNVEDDLLTLTLGSQGVYSIRAKLCNFIMNMNEDDIRVITPDVGGGFGTKLFMYHEYPLCLAAAKKLGRPVRWFADRTEHFLADVHGRDNITTARLGLDINNRFVALDIEILADMGAYLSDFSTLIPWFGASMATGLYDIPAAHAKVKCVYTNTAPTDAYRGAGRPEAAYLLERLVDYTAQEIGVDAAELRRINFVKPEQFPYKTPTGRTIDVGEFDGHLTRALHVADRDGFEERRAGSAAKGKLRGFGFASYIEACAFAGSEPAHVSLQEDGSVFLRIGTQSTGQGHQTAYAQFIAAQLDLDPDQIHVHQGDTSVLNEGGGTGGSRSIPLGGVSVNHAAHVLGEKMREVASDKLEAAVDDLEFSGGFVEVMGTDRRISFADIAAASDEVLEGAANIEQEEATYPNGTHVCELEVDPATGIIELVRYTVVDDFGVTVNPLLLAGQVHGGIVQGIGQALHERTYYDETGQLLTASFMDYGMPRADHFPDFHFETRNVPSTTNALGIKGAGEAGAIGSTPAVMNALVNALHNGSGIKHIDMPALPHKVWAAINDPS